MAEKSSKRDALWIEAKRRCRLNQEDIRMAKEMGLAPRSLIKNIPAKTQEWKMPVKDWIREMYQKRQQQAAKTQASTKQAGCTANSYAAEERERAGSDGFALGRSEPVADSDRRHVLDQDEPSRGYADPLPADPDEENVWDEDGRMRGGESRPSEQEITAQDQAMLRRQSNFRLAAAAVAAAFSRLAAVEKIVLFGSVAVPLEKEIPRFREYRRHRSAVWHECKDVDLAVWMSNLDHLRHLQRARSSTLNEVYQKQSVGVAHHQVEVFIMEPKTDHYLGRLCTFTRCPRDKPDCLVTGCGDIPYLKQQKGFVFSQAALEADKTTTLFDRQGATPLKDDNDAPLP